MSNMLFSYKVQKACIISFCCSIIISVLYAMLISIGEEPLINSNFIFSIVLGLVMCLSAMIAPFCEEKNEDESVKAMRRELSLKLLSVIFCVVMLYNMMRFVLIASDMEEVVPSMKLVHIKVVLLFELIYFIILKRKAKRHMK